MSRASKCFSENSRNKLRKCITERRGEREMQIRYTSQIPLLSRRKLINCEREHHTLSFPKSLRGEERGGDSRIFTAPVLRVQSAKPPWAASNVRITRPLDRDRLRSSQNLGRQSDTERNDPKSRLFLFLFSTLISFCGLGWFKKILYSNLTHI